MSHEYDRYHDTHGSRTRMMSFIERVAIYDDRDNPATKTGIEELSDSTILVARVCDVGAAIGDGYREIFPSLYSLQIYSKDATKKGQELASITITDGFDGYIGIDNRGHATVQAVSVPVDELDEMVGEFLNKNSLFEHIARSEDDN